MWSPLSSLTLTDGDHRSRLSLIDDDNEICVMHTYDMLCLQSLSSLGIRLPLCTIDPPYRHHNPISPFSVIMVQCQLVTMYYLRRHLYLARTNTSAHLDMINDHHDHDHSQTSIEGSSYSTLWLARNALFHPEPISDHPDDNLLTIPSDGQKTFYSYQMPSKQPIAVVQRKSNASRHVNDRNILHTPS